MVGDWRFLPWQSSRSGERGNVSQAARIRYLAAEASLAEGNLRWRRKPHFRLGGSRQLQQRETTSSERDSYDF